MENLWTRRNNSTKLSLTTPSSATNGSTVLDGESPASGRPPPATSTTSSFPRRSGADTPRRAGFGPLTGGLATPSSGAASTAFGLGQGAFASFGSASKTAKTTGNPFESAGNFGGLGPRTPAATATMTASPDEEAAATPRPGAAIKSANAAAASKPTASSVALVSEASMSSSNRIGVGSPSDEGAPLTGAALSSPSHPLRDSWCFWFRPPLAKGLGYLDYEKTLHGIATVRTVEDFFTVYRHLKRPSALPTVSDYYLFKEGIRPIWEDDENRKGGRWVVRMKKGVADRYWEDLQLALIGDQFADEGEDVCGAVLSIRNGEDTLSIWTRVDGGRVLKIRETMKHVLGFPPNTRLEFKSHDSSIQQRTAVEERREKGGGNNNNSNTNSNSNTQNNNNNSTNNNNNNNNINNNQTDNRRHSLISALLPPSSGRGFDDPRPETAAAGA